MKTTTTNSYPFLEGGGEMGDLIRRYDWGKTPVGPPDQWPQSLRTIVNLLLTSRFPMFLFWGPELIQFYNDAYRPSLGNDGKHPMVLGQPGADWWPESWHLIKPLIDQVLSGGEATWNEDQLFPFFRNGKLEKVYWTFSYSPVRDDFDQIAGVLVVCQETTRQVEQARQSQQGLSIALQAAQLGVWELDPATNWVNWDDHCRSLFGLAGPNSIPYEQVISYIHPDDVDRVHKAVQWAMNPESGGHYNCTYRTVGADDGILRWVRFTGRGYFTETGQISRFAGVGQDVTEEVLVHQKIEANEKRLQNLFEQAPVVLSIVGREPDFVYKLANAAFAELVDRPLDQILGKPLLEALPDIEGQGFDELLRQVATTGIPYIQHEAPVELVRQGQRQSLYFDFMYSPLRESDGEITGVIGLVIDVTQQVKGRQLVEASEAKLRSVIATAPAAMGLFVGQDLVVELPNQAFIDIVGKGPDIVGKPLREVMPELETENQPFLHILDEVYRTGKTFQSFGSQVRIVQNGVMTDNYYNITYSPLFDAQDQVYAILDIAIDVTEEIKARKQAEESEVLYRNLSEELENRVQQRTQELEQANQDLKRSNENLQQFAYVASHDLQEPLRKIQSFSELLNEQYGTQLGDEGNDLLQRISSAGARMSTLIKDLLTYSRLAIRQQSFGLVSLDAIVASVLSTLEWTIEQRRAHFELDELPIINGDESQLGQLFQNLLSNALKFTPMGQVPHIKVRCHKLAASELPLETRLAGTATFFYQISVSDQGVGFDTKYLDRIFQVFQRLHGKKEFPGTGVGLAICQRVVENHGGGITAVSKPGEGATFFVYLPG